MSARIDADEVRDWVEENWKEDITVREWWRRLVESGLAHPTWPVGVGGRSSDPGDARTVLGVLAERGCVGPAMGNVGAGLAAPTILEAGTAEQSDELVKPIALGETSWCQLWSEPGAGSDLAGLSARAEADGDDWVITGQKVWNSGADESDMGMLIARTDAAAPKHEGITYFALEMNQPGVEVRPLKVMDGTTRFCEVFLTEARVHKSRIIGGLHRGWEVTRMTMRHERTATAAGAVAGLVAARSGRQGDLDRSVGDVVASAARTAADPTALIRGGAVPAKVMIRIATENGRTSDPLVRQDLARYYSQVKVNGWTARRSAAARGRLTGADGSIAKLSTSRICQHSREVSYRIVGAPLMLDGPISPLRGELQQVNLNSPGNRIGGGTDEIQLNTLGERALGLPREPTDSGRSDPSKEMGSNANLDRHG